MPCVLRHTSSVKVRSVPLLRSGLLPSSAGSTHHKAARWPAKHQYQPLATAVHRENPNSFLLCLTQEEIQDSGPFLAHSVLCGTGNPITWHASCQAFELTSGWIQTTKMMPLNSPAAETVSCKTSCFPLISGDFRDLTDSSLYWGSKTSSESNPKTARGCDRTQDMP